MKSSLTDRPTNLRRRAFTLVEVTVAASLIGILGIITYGVLRSGTVLSNQNTSINVSASRARMALDQIGERVRYAMQEPTLITKDGAETTGSADGLLIKKLIGSPYVVKDSSGGTADLPDTTKQFVLEFRADLPVPQIGDWILMETVSRPELEITGVSSMAASGGVQRRLISTNTALGEVARPSYYRIGGFLYRKEAYVFAAQDSSGDPRYELRHFPQIKGTTSYTVAANYNVRASGYRRLSNGAFFTEGTSNSADLVTLKAMVNSSNRIDYIARQSAVSTFTTVPIQLRLWSLNR